MATNSLNRLENVYYRVVITGGFAVDPIDPEDFNPEIPDLPTTLAFSLDIEEANMRYEAVIRSVSERISPLQTSAIVLPTRAADAPETELEFTLCYDRHEYVDTEDETNVPARLTGADAIKRWVARGLINDEVENRDIFDPTLSLSAIRNGPQIVLVTATAPAANLAAAEAGLTVTEIANVDDKP